MSPTQLRHKIVQRKYHSSSSTGAADRTEDDEGRGRRGDGADPLPLELDAALEGFGGGG